MNDSLTSQKALQMREAFDLSFAQALQPPQIREEQLLAIRVAGVPYALRLRDISGLASGKEILRLPSKAEAFLGLATIQGKLVPTWDLATLMGYGPTHKKCGWLAEVAGEMPWAAAFEGFEGTLSLGQHDLSAFSGQGKTAAFVREVYGSAEIPRALIHLSSVSETIQGICYPI